MKLAYAIGGGWESSKEKILSRDKVLELLYNLYSDSLGAYVVAGVGIDKELKYVEKLAKNKRRTFYIFQPDEDMYPQLINLFRDYDNVKVIKDVVYKCKRHLSRYSVERFYALNIVNWKPQHFLTLLEGIYNSLSKSGKLIISLYVYRWPHARDRKDVVDTPKEVLKIFNGVTKPIAHYYDDVGILAVYVVSKTETGEIYRRLKSMKREINERMKEYEEKTQSYKMFFS